MTKTVSEKAKLALELFADLYKTKYPYRYIDHRSLDLPNGISAYYHVDKDWDYARFEAFGIEYNPFVGNLIIKFGSDVEPFQIDFQKWIDEVLAVLRADKKSDMKLEDFKLDVKPVQQTNRLIDEAIVKAKLFDQLMNREKINFIKGEK